MNYQGKSYRQDKGPFFQSLGYSSPLESNAYHHRNQVYIVHWEPKCNLVQLYMSRPGTVCMRRQHGIARPGKEWRQ